jgi:cytidine diphosphoramidate kinase
MVVWLIGLAGAGKTTIGRALYSRLRETKPNVVFLDGDDFRAIMGNDLGHTLEDRHANAWRICRLCAYLDRQGIDVVCAILSLFQDTRDWNREHYSQYVEVYVDVPLTVLKARDQKQLYSRAAAGEITNVAGVDLPFAAPESPDVVLDNADFAAGTDVHVARIMQAIESSRR